MGRNLILILSSILILNGCSDSSADSNAQSSDAGRNSSDAGLYQRTSGNDTVTETERNVSDATRAESGDVGPVSEDGTAGAEGSDAVFVGDAGETVVQDATETGQSDATETGQSDATETGQSDATETEQSDATETEQNDVAGTTGDVASVDDLPSEDVGEAADDTIADPAENCLVAAGDATAEPAICTGLCGDANMDGAVDVCDLLVVTDVVEGADSSLLCLEDADIMQDGGISLADQNLLSLLISGGLEGACAPCALDCGDVNGDGAIDLVDVEYTVDTILNSSPPYIACRYWAADVDGDGDVNVLDTNLIISQINPQEDESVTPLACAP